MPLERAPRHPLPRDHVPPEGIPYQVCDGDTWETIAHAHGLRKASSLIEYNFQTRSPAEINYYLRHHVGCVRTTEDGKNWVFSGDARPGRIHLPPPHRREAAGTGDHVLLEGETFDEVAYRAGFTSEKLWEDPGNAELKQVREQSRGIRLGDRIHLPVPQPKEVSCATDRRHTFRRRGRLRGVLEVHLDLDEGLAALREDAFKLTGHGGWEPYEARRSLKDDADPRDHGVTLVFGGLPMDARYTLQVTLDDGSEVTLFENVPYDRLNGPSDDLVPQAVEPQ